VIFLCLLFLGACKLQEESVSPIAELDEGKINQLKNWFGKKNQYLKSGQVYWHPQWGDGLLHTLNDGSQIAVFPIWREASVQYYDIGYIRRLVIKLDADGEIISGKILEMVSSKEYLRVHKEDIPVRFYEGTLQNSDALAWESELDNSQKSKNIGKGSCVPHTTFTTGPDGCTVFVIQRCAGVIQQAQIFEGACTSGGGFGGPPPPTGGTPTPTDPSEPGGGGASPPSDGGTPIYTPCDGATLEGVPCTPLDEGNNTIDVPIEPVSFGLITITNTNTLNAEEKAKLLEVFGEWLNASEYNQKIYNYFTDPESPMKFNFQMDPNLPGPAGFNHTNMNISFRSIEDIKYGSLWEEFFHAYQHKFYDGLEQYSSVGRSNIEFEAKLAHDLLGYKVFNPSGPCCLMFEFSTATQEDKDNYQKWIQDITQWGDILPDNFNQLESKYWVYLERFKIVKPIYNYPTDTNLLPNAMFHLFNN
jgi:hypothetical protein